MKRQRLKAKIMRKGKSSYTLRISERIDPECKPCNYGPHEYYERLSETDLLHFVHSLLKEFAKVG